MYHAYKHGLFGHGKLDWTWSVGGYVWDWGHLLWDQSPLLKTWGVLFEGDLADRLRIIWKGKNILELDDAWGISEKCSPQRHAHRVRTPGLLCWIPRTLANTSHERVASRHHDRSVAHWWIHNRVPAALTFISNPVYCCQITCTHISVCARLCDNKADDGDHKSSSQSVKWTWKCPNCTLFPHPT